MSSISDWQLTQDVSGGALTSSCADALPQKGRNLILGSAGIATSLVPCQEGQAQWMMGSWEMMGGLVGTMWSSQVGWVWVLPTELKVSEIYAWRIKVLPDRCRYLLPAGTCNLLFQVIPGCQSTEVKVLSNGRLGESLPLGHRSCRPLLLAVPSTTTAVQLFQVNAFRAKNHP